MPLVLTAVIVSIANLRQVTNAAKLAVQTLVWFAITSLIAVTIGIVIGLVTSPGANATIGTAGAKAPSHSGSWLDFLQSIVPANILGLESDEGSLSFNVLQLVVIGIALGAAALAVGPKATPFFDFTRSVLDIFSKLVWWIIRLAPIGSAGLIGKAVASYGWDLVSPLGRVHHRRLCGLRDRAVHRVSAAGPCARPEPASLLCGCLAGDPVRVRVPFVGGHAAADAAGGDREPRRLEGLRVVRRPDRRHHEDGRLRGDLPGAGRHHRRAALRGRRCMSPTTC